MDGVCYSPYSQRCKKIIHIVIIRNRSTMLSKTLFHGVPESYSYTEEEENIDTEDPESIDSDMF